MAHLLTRKFVFGRLGLSRSAGYRLFASRGRFRVSSDTVVDALNRVRRGGQPVLSYAHGVPDDLCTADEMAAALEGAEIAARDLLRWARRKRNVPPHFRLNPRCIRFRRSEVLAWLKERTA